MRAPSRSPFNFGQGSAGVPSALLRASPRYLQSLLSLLSCALASQRVRQRRATGPRSGGIFRASPVALVYACYRGSLSWLCGLSAIVPLGLLPLKDHGSPKPRIRKGEMLHSEHCSVDPCSGAMPPNSWWTVKLRRTSPSLRSAAILCKVSLNSSLRNLATFTLQKHYAAQARQALRNCSD